METAGLERSMSKKGYSPDNAACEGLFGRLKGRESGKFRPYGEKNLSK